ncbi:phage holin, LLH family [uncultured Clostridium sp.]|uniref:phage holin, LLH family n=1 Tax=uncultured Clostridium sp. TaxID=59620 RepID=UPI00262A32D0|nr:phage holin, LLH family [uncultured Clostridium sp.]
MDWSIVLDYLLKIIGSIGATIITTLAGILFTKLSSKIKDSRISNYVKEVVKAAEQLYPNEGTKMGPEKYAYVVQEVIAKFPKLTNNAYLKSLIEGAVFALNNQLEEVTKKQIETTQSVTQENKEESRPTISIQ